MADRSPPAAARGLQREARPHRGGIGGAAEEAEVVVEIGDRQRIEIAEDRARRLALGGAPAVPVRRAVDPRRQLAGRDLPPRGEDAPAEIGDQGVRLPRHHVVDPREGAMGGPPHDPLAVGAAQQGDHRGIDLADAASRASEAACCSKVEVQPTTRAPVASTCRAARSTKPAAARRTARRSSTRRAPPRRPGGTRHHGMEGRDALKILLVAGPRRLAESGLGEGPLPGQEVLRELGREMVEAEPDLPREREVGIDRRGGDPRALDTALSSPSASEGRFSEA